MGQPLEREPKTAPIDDSNPLKKTATENSTTQTLSATDPTTPQAIVGAERRVRRPAPMVNRAGPPSNTTHVSHTRPAGGSPPLANQNQ